MRINATESERESGARFGAIAKASCRQRWEVAPCAASASWHARAPLRSTQSRRRPRSLPAGPATDAVGASEFAGSEAGTAACRMPAIPMQTARRGRPRSHESFVAKAPAPHEVAVRQKRSPRDQSRTVELVEIYTRTDDGDFERIA